MHRGGRGLTLLALLALVPRVTSQSLDSVYWTGVIGDQQPGTYSALAVVNASAVQVFGGSASAGVVPTTIYFQASQSLVSSTAPTLGALPTYGAAVAPIPPFASAPYSAYAFGGAIAGVGTAPATISSSWLAWDGAKWTPLTVSGPATFPRVFATATYLSNCQGTGSGCILLLGGYTPGTPLSMTGLGTWILWIPPTGTPTFSAVVTSSGATAAPLPRHSHVAAASPDGTTVFVYGGVDSTGAVVSDMFALNTAGWADSEVVLSELYNLAQDPAVQLSAQPMSCPRSSGPCASMNPRQFGLSLTADVSSRGAGNIMGWAYRAIDGRTSGNYLDATVTRAGTDNYVPGPGQPPARFRLDLVTERSGIVQIQLFWRTDCCLQRTSGFQVYLGNNDTYYNGASNVQVVNPFTDAVSSPTILAVPNIAARYVWVALPGARKVLGIAEIYVLQRKPFVWRQLTGMTNVALYSNAWQSSADNTNAATVAVSYDASVAVNGILNDTSATSSAIALGNPLAGVQYWAVDFGSTYSVQSILYTDGSCASALRTPASAANVMFYLGSNADYKQNSKCHGPVATSTRSSCTGGTGSSWVNRVVPSCTGTARYLHIVKQASTTAGVTGQHQNMITIGEVQVNAQSMPNLPSARAGAGSATYGAYLVVFGGYSAVGGSTLNDLYFFDMVKGAWLVPPKGGYLGTAPVTRSNPVMMTLSATFFGVTPAVNQVVLFGGVSSSGLLTDMTLLNFPACAALSTANTAFANFSNAGLSCSYVCATGYTSMNALNYVYCGPDGNWVGALPLCAATSAALLPAAPTGVNAVTGSSPGTATVTWTPAVGVNPSATSFIVAALPPDFVDYLNRGSMSWLYYNGDVAGSSSTEDSTGSGTNTYTWAANGNLAMATQISGTCAFNTQRCGAFSRPFPTGIPNLTPDGSWAYEASVAFAPFGKQYPVVSATATQYIGITLYDDEKTATGIVSTGVHHWFAGLSVTSTGISVGFRSFASASLGWWIPTATTFPEGFLYPSINPLAYKWNAYIRVERDAANLRWRLGYRYSLEFLWSYSPWFPDSTMLRGGSYTSPANLHMGLMATSTSTQRQGYGEIEFVRWGPLNTTAPGFSTTVAAPLTAATVSGLSPGVPYAFSVTPVTAAGKGPSSIASPLTLAAPLAITVPWVSANLLLVSSGKSAIRYSSTLGSVSASGLTDNSFTTVISTSPTSSLSPGDWVMIDLSIPSAVKEIAIWASTVAVEAAQLNNFRALVGKLPDWRTAQACDPMGVPTSVGVSNLLNTSGTMRPYAVRFPCSSPTGLVGRYIFIQAAPGSYLALTEVQVYTTNQCAAPRVQPWAATNVPGGKCSTPNALYGASCVQTCNNGYANIAGSFTSTCNGDTWSDAPLVCAATCGTRAMPNLASKCTQGLFVSDFTQYFPVNGTWQDIKSTPASLGSQFTIGGGILQASAMSGTGSEMTAVVVDTTLNSWLQGFTWVASVNSPTGARVGIVWRAQDQANLYRAVLNPLSGIHTIERIVGGVVTVIATAALTLKTNTFYSLSVDSTGTATSTFTINLNGQALMSVQDKTFVSGFPGLYSSTGGIFSSASFLVDCTGVGCANTRQRGTCAFTCDPGLTVAGPSNLKCIANPLAFNGVMWDNNNGTFCVLAPPVFFPVTRSVVENAPKNTFVGSPVQASLTSPLYQLTYSIIQQFRVRATNTTLIAQSVWPFTIDSCTGQVRVLSTVCTGAPNCPFLNFEDPNWNTFALLVQVSTNGPAASVRANVTVMLTNVDEPPAIVGATVSIPENSPPNTVVGMVPYFDPDTPLSLQSFVYVTGSPLFAISSSGAILTTALTSTYGSLNFEALGGNPVFGLSVTVTQTLLAANTGTGTFSITLIDRDDAPQLVTTTPLSILEATALNAAATIATTPLPVGGLVSTDEDVGIYVAPPIYYQVPSATAVALYPQCVPVLPVVLPTTDLTTIGMPLFSISTAGAVNLIATPVGAAYWLGATPFSFNGAVLRAAYMLCVNSTDKFGAWAVAGITVTVNASNVVLPTVSTMTVNGIANALQTAGGDTVDVTGTYFSNYPAKLVLTGPTGTFTGNCGMTVPTTQYTCTVPPGVGGGLTMSLSVNSGSGTFVTALTQVTPEMAIVSYAQPTIDSVVGMNVLRTIGGDQVTFTGANFGPQSQPLAFPTIKYGFSLEYTCSNFVVTATPQTTLTCITSAGVGADMPWVFTIAGFSPLQGTPGFNDFAYLPPSITNLNPGPGVDPNNLLTTGGQALTFVGTNLGPLPSASFTLGANISMVFASSIYGVAPISTTACIRSVPHTTIVCTTPPGVGGYLALTLVIAGVSSAPYLTPISYAPPNVTSMTGAVFNAPTCGGVQVVLRGVNFGPPGTIPINVTYGHPEDVTRYMATSCVSVNDGEMTCQLSPGVGRGLVWLVNVGGQFSPIFAASTSYAAPIILAYSGPGAVRGNTVGNDMVVITGQNFGPNDEYTNSRLTVSYGTTLVDPVAGTSTLTYTPSSCGIASPSPEFNANCTNELIVCYTEAGAGANLQWRITLDGQVSVPPTTSYAAPQVSAITAFDSFSPVLAANVDGGDIIFLKGINFGPSNYSGWGVSLVQSLKFGPSGSEYNIPSQSFTVINDNLIQVILPPGYGSNLFFSLTVADQVNILVPGVSFGYAAASLVGPVALYPSTGSTSGCISGYTTSSACSVGGSGCDVGDAASAVYVCVSNLPYLDTSVSINAFIGTIDRGTVAAPQNVGFGTSQALSLQVITPSPLGSCSSNVSIIFYVPPGAGLRRSFQLSIAGRNNVPTYTPLSDPASLFSYADPIISSVVVTKAVFGGSQPPCPFSAADVAAGWVCSDTSLVQLQILGYNFGQLPVPCNGAGCATPSSCTGAAGGDGTLKWLSIGNASSPFVRQDATVSPAIYVAPNWQDTFITAFVRVTAGTVAIRIDSSSAQGCPATPDPPTDGLPASPGSCFYQYATGNFTQLSPQVLTATSTPTLLNSVGGDYVLLTIANLRVGSGLSVFFGDPDGPSNQFLGATNILFAGFPAACPGLSPAASLSAFLNNQLSVLPAPEFISVCVQTPAGQGSNVPVVAVRTTSSPPAVDKSNLDVKVNYVSPVVSTIAVFASDGVTLISSQPVSPTALIQIPTEGGAIIKFTGTNLGSAPTVAIGDGYIFNASSVLSCGAPHTCYSIVTPPGEGAGTAPTYPLSYTATLARSLTWTGGFPIMLFAGNQVSPIPPVRLTYSAPTVTRIVSLEQDGAFPVIGGTPIFVVGTDFGVTPPGRSATTQLVWLYRGGLPLPTSCSSPMCSPCTNVMRVNTTTLMCTLAAGSAGSATRAMVVIAGQLSPMSTNALFVYDSNPAVTLVNVVGADNSVVPGTTCGLTAAAAAACNVAGLVLRAPTNGLAFMHICGTSFGSSPNITVGYMTYSGADVVPCSALYGKVAPFACYQVPVPAGEGDGTQYGGRAWSMTVNHYSQLSTPISFAYNYPLVTRIASLNDTFPTEGGVWILVSGNDFGTTPPATVLLPTSSSGLTQLSFGLPPCHFLAQNSPAAMSSPCTELAQCDAGFMGFSQCTDVQRFNDSMAMCLLPEGVGANLWARLTVGGQSTAPLDCISSSMGGSCSSALCPVTHDSPYVLSYDLPVLSTLPGAITISGTTVPSSACSPSTLAWGGNSIYPLLCDSTKGGSVITITGTNFGPSMPLASCVFLTWANRPASSLVAIDFSTASTSLSYMPTCNGVVDWAGEGEIQPAAIVSWSHTSISFTVPPGLGWKQIVLSVRGGKLALPSPAVRNVLAPIPGAASTDPNTQYLAYFHYADPVITSLSPSLVGTDGGTLVTITGSNFGPSPFNTSVQGGTPLSFSSTPALQVKSTWEPLDGASDSSLSSAYMVIVFNRACAAFGLDASGAPVSGAFFVPWFGGNLSLSACTCADASSPCGLPAFVSQSHNSISFYAPGGVGVNRTVQAFMVEPPGASGNPTVLAAQSLIASYRPPQVSRFSESQIDLGDPMMPQSLSIFGTNFGNPDLMNVQNWTAEERVVAISINGAPCPMRSTLRVPGQGTVLTCTVSHRLPVGFSAVTVTIAGQTATTTACAAAPGQQNTRALLLDCQVGYYAHPGEVCEPCPAVSLNSLAPSATCSGPYDPGLASPVLVYHDWAALWFITNPTTGKPALGYATTNPSITPLPVYPKATFATQWVPNTPITTEVLVLGTTTSSWTPSTRADACDPASKLVIPSALLGSGVTPRGVLSLTDAGLWIWPNLTAYDTTTPAIQQLGVCALSATPAGVNTWLLKFGAGSFVSHCAFATISAGNVVLFETVSFFDGGSSACPANPDPSNPSLFTTVVPEFFAPSCVTPPPITYNTSYPPPCPAAWAALPAPTAISDTWHGSGNSVSGVTVTVVNNSITWFSPFSGTMRRYCVAVTAPLPQLSVPGGSPVKAPGYPTTILGLAGYTPVLNLLGRVDLTRTLPYPYPNPGYYNLNGPMASACPLPTGHDYGRDVCIVACVPAAACLGKNLCAPEYISVAPKYRCATCAPGFYSINTTCIKCPDSPLAVIIIVLLMIIVLAGAGYVLNKRQVNIAVLSIGVDFFQVLAIFSDMQIVWPPDLIALFKVLSAFNLNISIVAPECVLPGVTFKDKFYFIMAMPVIFLAFLGTVFTVQVTAKWCRGHRDRAKLYSHASALVSSALVLVYLLYLYITRTVMGVFNCMPTSPPDGHTYLSGVVPLDECGVPGGSQVKVMPIGVVALLTYSLGYPVFILQKLWRNRELIMEDQLLRAKGVGNDRLTNPHAYAFRRMFGRSYFQFKPDWVLWILAIIARKFCIAVTAVMFNKNASFQMCACLFIMLISYTAQVQIRPYMSPSDRDEVLRDHEAAAATSEIHSRLRATIVSIETAGRKKARKNLLTFEGKIDSSAVLGLLTSWAFNYNTIEAIMLFSAIMVCLLALMYQASIANAYYASARGAVTGVIIFVISGAIAYFFTVITVEIWTLATEASRRQYLLSASLRAKRGAATSKGDADASSATPTKGGKSPKLTASRTAKDFDPGVISARMNPIFMKQGSASDAGGADAAATSATPEEKSRSMTSTIAAQREAPPPELWTHFHSSLGELMETVRRAQDELRALEASEAALVLAAEVAAATGRIEGARAVSVRAPREEFGSKISGSNPLAEAAGSLGTPSSARTRALSSPGNSADALSRYASPGAGSRRAVGGGLSPRSGSGGGVESLSPLARLRAATGNTPREKG